MRKPRAKDRPNLLAIERALAWLDSGARMMHYGEIHLETLHKVVMWLPALDPTYLDETPENKAAWAADYVTYSKRRRRG